jgi:hypothetical protein
MFFVLLTLQSGVEVMFIPKLESYFDIKKDGAQAWWADQLAAAVRKSH